MSDGFDCLHVTDITVVAVKGLLGTRALALLVAWAAPFGFDPGLCPLGYPLVRDVAGRRIYYPVIDMAAAWEACVRTEFVQLEAAPPPWPREIRESA